ncbi:hypothetical protein MNBD_GAMMA16-897 [hydrothermal vent metagenome]|uniref:Uncharacterized protein n=1 Tax=hydrothermal vent metagenome TaxID=652676 RepID=A0A3B0ZDC1_9ZZZZ
MKNKTQIITALSLSLLFLVGCESGTETTLNTEQGTIGMNNSVLQEMERDITNETKDIGALIENKTEAATETLTESLEASKEAANDVVNN